MCEEESFGRCAQVGEPGLKIEEMGREVGVEFKERLEVVLVCWVGWVLG